MICPHCHQVHPDGSRFCTVTGKAIAENSQSISKDKCPNCGKPLKPGSVYCDQCGKLVMKRQESRLTKKIPWYFFVIGGVLIIGILGILLIPGFLPLIKGETILSSGSQDPKFSATGPVADLSVTTPPPTVTFEGAEVSVSSSEATTEVTFTKSVTATIATLPISTDIRENEKDKAKIVLIPAGEFNMGSDPKNDPYFWGAEAPLHKVNLDAFWIYQYEITVKQYKQCVKAGVCPRPQVNSSETRDHYFDDSAYNSYPVVYVTYDNASTYCRWAGGRLPTEAEWEKAARGDQDDRLFPWGSKPAEGNLANFCDKGCPGGYSQPNKNDGYIETSPVGNYPDGVSPYGLYDVAGNVWEWVLDYFSTSYYGVSQYSNPYGPASGQTRVIRGGGWNNPSEGVRVVQRSSVKPNVGLSSLGFRCVVPID